MRAFIIRAFEVFLYLTFVAIIVAFGFAAAGEYGTLGAVVGVGVGFVVAVIYSGFLFLVLQIADDTRRIAEVEGRIAEDTRRVLASLRGEPGRPFDPSP